MAVSLVNSDGVTTETALDLALLTEEALLLVNL